MADRTNFSELAGTFARDWGAVIRAATEVVQDHVTSCQASFLRAELKMQRRAKEQYGLANAWRYFASPAVLDLAVALRKLDGAPPPLMVPTTRPLGPVTPTERAL